MTTQMQRRYAICWLYEMGVSMNRLGELFYGRRHHVNVLGILQRAGIKTRPHGRAFKYRCDPTAFDVMTPEAMYWLGFIFADGHISRTKYSRVLELCLSRVDIRHIEKLREFLKSDYPIKPGTRTNTQFKVGDRQLTERLLFLGLGRESLMRIPSARMVASRDFWRGVVDGDGTICLRRNTACVGVVGGLTVVNGFATWAREICPRIDAQVVPSKESIGFYSFHTEGHTAVEVITALYGEASVALDRKAALAAIATRLPKTYIRRRFTLEEDAMIHNAAASMRRGAFAEVGRRIGLGTSNVWQRAHHLGLVS